jgi:exodeoxyribonuclease V alpha subunit
LLQDHSYFSGRVHSIVFENEAKAFYILRVILDEGSSVQDAGFDKVNGSVTVRGDIPGLQVGVGTWFGFEGVWDNHPQYGRQIKIIRAPVMKKDWDADTSEKILMSNGIGPSIAAKLKVHFGEDLATALLDPEKISAVPGMGKFTALHVFNRWQAARAHFLALEFLNDLGLPQGRIRQIWGTFGDSAQEVLSVNPWALVQIEGVTFRDADTVAMRLHLDTSATNKARIEGAVLHACRSGRGFGHLYSSSGDMLGVVRAIDPAFSDKDVAEAVKALADQELLIVDRVVHQGVTAIYDPWSFKIESESSEILLERAVHARIPQEIEATYVRALIGEGETATSLLNAVNLSLERLRVSGSISLSKAQSQGVRNALCEPVSIISGLPGTGKTVSIRIVVSLLQEAGIQFLLVAPTGIAAKRVASVTGAPASTIHRAFKAKGSSEDGREATYTGVVGDRDSDGLSGLDGSSEVWGFSEDNPHPAEVILCDEASMVDQHLLYRILTCTRKEARLVFVGDAAQLPSVGPGNVLRDMIASGLFPTVSLTEIFRQADTSPIVHAAHAIHRGQVPDAPVGSDFSFMEVSNEEKVADIIVSAAEKLFMARRIFQVLSPRHSGPVGVTSLNARLRELLNPKQASLHEMRIGSDVLREDDRIMVVRNDYKLGIFNGDVGKIVSIDKKNKEVEIKIHGPPVMHLRVPFAKAPAILRLAYAVTVHKCVHPDTLIETEEGLLPISKIRLSGVVGSPDGPRSYSMVISNPEAPALRIQTKDGYSLVATLEHGLDVWDGTSYVRMLAGDVRPGSVLRLRLGSVVDPVKPAYLPNAPAVDVRASTFTLPSVVSDDVAEFLGLMVADGTVFDRGFRLAKRHLDLADRFADLCRSLFGVEPKRFFTLGAHHVEVNSVFLVEWLRLIGGLTPHDKFVPECILRSPLNIHSAFLRGVFADGTVNARKSGVLDHIEWFSVFPTLRDTVRTMLLRFGVIAGATPRREQSLYIYGENAVRFGQLVGFVEQTKQACLLLPCGAATKYSIPISKAEASNLRREHVGDLGIFTCQNAMNRGCVSRATAQAILDAGRQTKSVDVLRERLQYHHSKVIRVEPVVCPSMCLEVPDGHRFLQNGFSGWNSQGQEYDVIVMPIVNSFSHQLQRNLLYTAVTRARKKVILVGTRSALVRAVSNERESSRNTLLKQRLLTESGSSVVASKA